MLQRLLFKKHDAQGVHGVLERNSCKGVVRDVRSCMVVAVLNPAKSRSRRVLCGRLRRIERREAHSPVGP